MFNAPLPSILQGGYERFLLSDIWIFVFLGDIWVLRIRIPHFQRKKKNSHRKGLGRGTLNTYIFSGSYLLQTAWTFGLLCGKVQKARLCIVITWFQCIFDFRRWIWRNIGPTQSVLRIFALTLYTLEHLEAARSEKKDTFFLPTVSAWLLFTSLKACDWSEHIFGASDSPRPSTKELAMSPSSTVQGGQHYTKCDIRVAIACGIRC